MPRIYIAIFFSLLLLTVSACAPQPTDIPTVPPTLTETLPPLVSPTPAARALTVCLGGEPNTLYPYGNPNSPARSVMSALFDGPMDIVEYGYEPVILENMPRIDDGDAQVASITVNAGDLVVASNGDLVTLDTGVVSPFTPL